MDFKAILDEDEAKGILPHEYRMQIESFYTSYVAVREKQGGVDVDISSVFYLYLQLLEQQVASPHPFESYHKRMTHPTDYTKFGIDVIKGIIDIPNSSVTGLENIETMVEQQKRGENVVLLANHQTEPDPQAISILLADTYPEFATELVWVAGERVLIDPMAAPFSMGRNLLCVYSKKYIAEPPEKRGEKQAHNTRTMHKMNEMLKEGGWAILVAPGGGRDRPAPDGDVPISKFDAKAVHMFRLIAEKAGTPVHFYPLALATYHLLPPPSGTGEEGWEPRYTEGGGVHLSFGPEIDMDNFPGSDTTDRPAKREALAQHVWNLVNDLYRQFPKEARTKW